MNAFLFARLNTSTITCEIRNDHSCQNIQLASRLQAHILHQHENIPMHLRSAFMAPCHHRHLWATGLHHTQVRHLFRCTLYYLHRFLLRFTHTAFIHQKLALIVVDLRHIDHVKLAVIIIITCIQSFLNWSTDIDRISRQQSLIDKAL